MRKVCKKSDGFSLVEMVVVLTILGLVFVGFSAGFGSFMQSKSQAESKQNVAHVKEMLLRFSAVNSHLPCPDTDGDGRENRTVGSPSIGGMVQDGSVEMCSADYGTVPYLDIGLSLEQVEDAWGNSIYFYVNTQADLVDSVCDKNSAASYFCNEHAPDTARFTQEDTPPLANPLSPWDVHAVGDYIVCNENAQTCTANNTDDEADQLNVENASASVVLIAFNKDGAETVGRLGDPDLTIAASNENADNDGYFHKLPHTVQGSAFFDDDIETLSGYEIKSRSTERVVSWFSKGSESQVTSTYTDFDIDETDSVSISDGAVSDAINVNRNVSTALDLGGGDDYLAIGNDLDAGEGLLLTGEGDDQILIGGQANSAVQLGDGGDAFVLKGDLNSDFDAGIGNDKAWVLGSILDDSSFTLGSGDDVLWFGGVIDETATPVSADNLSEIREPIFGGDGYDILVLEDYESWDAFAATGQASHLNGFELVIFAKDNTGNRSHCEMDACGE